MRAPRGSNEGSEPMGAIGGAPEEGLRSNGSNEEAEAGGADSSWPWDPLEEMSLISSREMRLRLFFCK